MAVKIDTHSSERIAIVPQPLHPAPLVSLHTSAHRIFCWRFQWGAVEQRLPRLGLVVVPPATGDQPPHDQPLIPKQTKQHNCSSSPNLSSPEDTFHLPNPPRHTASSLPPVFPRKANIASLHFASAKSFAIFHLRLAVCRRILAPQ